MAEQSPWERWKNISLALGIPFMTVAMWLMVAALTPKNDDHEVCDNIRDQMPDIYEQGMQNNKEFRATCCQFHDHKMCQ